MADEFDQYLAKPKAPGAPAPKAQGDDFDQYQTTPQNGGAGGSWTPATKWDKFTKLRNDLTRVEQPDRNAPAGKEALKAVGNVGAGALAPILHPFDTLESIGGVITAPFEMMAGRKFSQTVPGEMVQQFKDNPLGTIEVGIGSAGTLGGLQEGLSAAVPEASPKGYSPRTKALTRASGTSGTVDIPKAWEGASPEIAKTVAQSPQPYEGVKGLQKAVQDTFDTTQNRYSLGLRKIATGEADTTRIGNNIRALKIADPATPEELARNAHLDKAAAEWDSRHINYQQADRLRETAGNDIRNYYSKVKPSDASAAAKNDIDIAINRIVDQDLGDVVYPAIDKANGLPEGTTKQLKLTQSSLYKLRDQLASQGIKMSNEEAQTVLQRLRAHSYISSHGTVGAALGGIAEALNPETSRVNRAVRRGLAPTTPTANPDLPVTTPKPIAPRKHPSDEYAQQ